MSVLTGDITQHRIARTLAVTNAIGMSRGPSQRRVAGTKEAKRRQSERQSGQQQNTACVQWGGLEKQSSGRAHADYVKNK